MNQIFLLASLLFSILTFTAGSNPAAAAPIPDPIYESLFPNYAEICGFNKKDRGNPGGHAILYVKGVCRDLSGDRPLVRRCTQEEIAANPQIGTSLSVDPIANNAWWVGAEDLNFVLFGGIPQNQPLDTPTFENLIQRATDEQLYGQIWPSPNKREKRPLAISIGKFLAGEGFGTDYGISLARKGSCWKIPISIAQVDAIILEANTINLALDRNKPTHWDFLSNNCVHFVVNLLAAAGVMEYVPTHLPFPAFLVDLEAPSTRILRTGRRINKGIPTVTQAFKNKFIRNTLVTFRRLPLQYGTILEYISFHEEGNYDFNDNPRFALPTQIKKLEKMEKEPKHTDLSTHLLAYRESLLSAQRLFEATPLERLVQKKKYSNPEFTQFYTIYENWLATSLDDLTSKILLING